MSEAVKIELPPLSLRPATPADHAFVYASWLRSYKHASYEAKRLKDRLYYAGMHARISRLLERNATVTLAVLPEDPQTIIGYVVHEGQGLHWIYVKQAFRRLGVASILFAGLGDLNRCEFSCWSYDADWLVKKYPGLQYNPYLLDPRHPHGT